MPHRRTHRSGALLGLLLAAGLTAAAPAAAAPAPRLNGDFEVHGKQTTRWLDDWSGQPQRATTSVTDTWHFKAKCKHGACDVVAENQWRCYDSDSCMPYKDHSPVRLHRRGSVYTGTADNYLCKNYQSTTDLRVEIKRSALKSTGSRGHREPVATRIAVTWSEASRDYPDERRTTFAGLGKPAFVWTGPVGPGPGPPAAIFAPTTCVSG